MTEQRCYYEILGCARTASGDELKKAYRKLAMQFHPDRNPGDHSAEAQFKEISEAYDILKDDQKRAAYDRFGHAAFNGSGGMGGARGGFDFSGSFSEVFEDLFGDFMGGGRGRRGGAQRGNDLRYDLEITLEDAFRGKKATLDLQTTANCDSCEGTGAKPGCQPTNCTTCKGAGKIRTQQGFFVVERACPTCGGGGQVIADPCTDCGGTGRINKDRTLSVNIPTGVDDGTRIRLSGEGEPGARGGPPGDLYIFLSIAPHKIFQREGSTLYCRVPIPMTLAALGGEIEVPTLSGEKAMLKIPEGTQSGRQFVLRSKGMPGLNARGQGDLVVQTQVEVPVHLNKRQKELLKEFAEESGQKCNPESEGFFTRVKEMWDGLTE